MLDSTTAQMPSLPGFSKPILNRFDNARQANGNGVLYPNSNDKVIGPSEPSSESESTYAVGTAPEEFYTRTLAPWRAAARRFIMRRLRQESEWIAKMQERLRSPWLDNYFVYTSSLGTHTFFMMALPALFFFGHAEVGRGLVFVLAMGVYVSSFIKDLICAPRPYAPPVSRLTIGSHHLEYGFPSTHSTNSVSIALYMYSLIHSQYFSAASISTTTYTVSCISLTIYITSIVFGRLYTGMHSIVDCIVGVALGAFVTATHALVWNPVESWLTDTHWARPLVVALLCGLVVHWHPQPADDCPCFEDAIAFVSVVSGELVSHWMSKATGFDNLTTYMPGSAWEFLSPSLMTSNSEAWRLSLLWWTMALLKLTIGISLIFIWRLTAKFLLHSLLPPLFRFVSFRILPILVSTKILPKGVHLPNRRFYTPATEYAGAVPEPEGGLHPIPSVIDLQAMLHERSHYELDGELGGMKRRIGKGRRRSTDYRQSIVSEEKSTTPILGKEKSVPTTNEESTSDDEEDVKHYDADVLTKVVVYAGIAILATGLIPIMFEVLGWGVHP